MNYNSSFVFPLFTEHLELNEELSLTASSKHDCMTAILFQTNTPEFRQNSVSSVDQLLECGIHVENKGRAKTMVW